MNRDWENSYLSIMINIPEDIKKVGGFFIFLLIASVVFSIFCLIYRTEYIYFGFVTFLYALIGHFWEFIFHSNIYAKKKPEERPMKLCAFVHTLLLIAYLVIMISHKL